MAPADEPSEGLRLTDLGNKLLGIAQEFHKNSFPAVPVVLHVQHPGTQSRVAVLTEGSGVSMIQNAKSIDDVFPNVFEAWEQLTKRKRAPIVVDVDVSESGAGEIDVHTEDERIADDAELRSVLNELISLAPRLIAGLRCSGRDGGGMDELIELIKDHKLQAIFEREMINETRDGLREDLSLPMERVMALMNAAKADVDNFLDSDGWNVVPEETGESAAEGEEWRRRTIAHLQNPEVADPMHMGQIRIPYFVGGLSLWKPERGVGATYVVTQEQAERIMAMQRQLVEALKDAGQLREEADVSGAA